jgi:hypothetical protein
MAWLRGANHRLKVYINDSDAKDGVNLVSPDKTAVQVQLRE